MNKSSITFKVARSNNITSAMYRVIWVVAFLATGRGKHHPHSKLQSQQTRDNHPMLYQCWTSVEDVGPTLIQHWVNATCLLGCCFKVYSRPCVGVVLVQRRRRFIGIEPAMGCDNGPTLSRNLMGGPTSCVRGTS